MEVSHGKSCYRSRCSKSGRDVVTSDDVWLLAGREGEDGDPGRENIGERVHLNEFVNNRLIRESRKVKPTIAEIYARFSGSCLFTSFTQVQVMPAAVPPSAVRSEEGRKSAFILGSF